VVRLAVGQSEEAFLEDRVLAVPQCEGKAEPLLVVGYSGDAILTPAVCPGTGLFMGKKFQASPFSL
jgi:hypothetical protein